MSLTGYKYHVFLSYAHANDHEGWVSQFRKKLTHYLCEILEEEPALFWDKQSLGPNAVLSSTIKQAVRDSAALVIILSKKYLTRPWCEVERDTFACYHGPAASRRMLIVRYDDTPFSEFQKVLPECLGIEFFDQYSLPLDSRSRDYKRGLFKLRVAIKEQLDAMTKDTPSNATTSDDRPTVFLAAGNTDTFEWRHQLMSALGQYGVRVVSPDSFFFLQESFEERVAKQLDDSVVFVQLLGDTPFPVPPQLPMGLERWFWEQANSRHDLGVMRWRKPAPLPNDLDFRAVVELSAVHSNEIAQFVKDVASNTLRLQQDRLAKAKYSHSSTLPIVVVRADEVDESAAVHVEGILASQGFDVAAVPPSSLASLEKVATDLVTGGLLLVFERSPEVLRRLQELRSFTRSHHFTRWVVGCWRHGSTSQLAIRLTALKKIHVIEDGDLASLERFVTELRQKAVHS